MAGVQASTDMVLACPSSANGSIPCDGNLVETVVPSVPCWRLAKDSLDRTRLCKCHGIDSAFHLVFWPRISQSLQISNALFSDKEI